MTQTNLLLEHYFYPTIIIKANPEFKPDESNETVGDFEVSTSASVKKDDENHFQLQMTIKTKDCDNFSYEIDLLIIGYFQVDPAFPDKKKLVNITGSSILYSAARDFVLTLTSKGPWLPVMLPTMSFVGGEKVAEDKNQITPSPKKSARKTSSQKIQR